MSYITNFDASNKADFIIDFSATDIMTGEDIDFTGAAISIKIEEENCSPIISASIGNGITLVLPTVLELRVTAAQMAVLRPISYRIGCVYSANGLTTQVFVGALAVFEGIASV